MQLSKRMSAVADMVTAGMRLADVGCDHGYLSIHLVQQKGIPGAIAMDINEGPLRQAEKNILAYGAAQYIATRRSDGVMELRPGEADAVVIAGMGGNLVIKILTQGSAVLATVQELILQPQSDIARVRRFLAEHQYRIVKEDMVFEDGKYYPMIKAIHGRMEDYQEIHYQYGKYLLENRHPVLYDYLKREERILKQIEQQIHAQGSPEASRRMEEIREEMRGLKAALAYYEV